MGKIATRTAPCARCKRILTVLLFSGGIVHLVRGPFFHATEMEHRPA